MQTWHTVYGDVYNCNLFTYAEYIFIIKKQHIQIIQKILIYYKHLRK